MRLNLLSKILNESSMLKSDVFLYFIKIKVFTFWDGPKKMVSIVGCEFLDCPFFPPRLFVFLLFGNEAEPLLLLPAFGILRKKKFQKDVAKW